MLQYPPVSVEKTWRQLDRQRRFVSESGVIRRRKELRFCWEQVGEGLWGRGPKRRRLPRRASDWSWRFPKPTQTQASETVFEEAKV